jgi:hypothetical protein
MDEDAIAKVVKAAAGLGPLEADATLVGELQRDPAIQAKCHTSENR